MFTALEPSQRPAVVMDCGTGFTKMGFAGNVQPSFIEPTAVSFESSRGRSKAAVSSASASDTDVLIGHEAVSSTASDAHYPVCHGLVQNWDHMERFWQEAVHRYLRVDSEDHNFILTEPPLNPPENREMAAEIMFETFNVPGLCIGIQAVLALHAAFAAADRGPKSARGRMTGTVIDSGAGCTHVIPVSDGFVIGSAIQSIPIAGRDLTKLVQRLMRERGEPVPGDLSMDVAQQIKERYCYTCGDLVKEFGKYDAQLEKHAKSHSFWSPRAGAQQACSVQHERFLAPELLFRPDFVSADYTTPLPQLVDRAIQSCPIDTRRGLYGNIVLSGGSTMFKDFGRRIQRDVSRAVDARQAPGGKAVEVHVASHAMQRYAVWFGGSVLGTMPQFEGLCKTRAEYEEYGPSICRNSAAFTDELL